MGRTKKDKDWEILDELYRLSFAASNPPGNWDEIFANAPVGDDGRKLIPYMDYECSEEKLNEIFNTTMEKHKVKPQKIKAFSFQFWLGCSPKTARKNDKEISGV